MPKYHLDLHGNPAVCRAKKQKCPRGGDDKHFNTKEECQAYQDKKNEKLFSKYPDEMHKITDLEGIINQTEKEIKKCRKTANENNLNDFIDSLTFLQNKIKEKSNFNIKNQDEDLQDTFNDVNILKKKTDKSLNKTLKTLKDYDKKLFYENLDREILEDKKTIKITDKIKTKEERESLIRDSLRKNNIIKNEDEIVSRLQKMHDKIEDEKAKYVVGRKMVTINEINNILNNEYPEIEKENVDININKNLSEVSIKYNNRPLKLNGDSNAKIEKLLTKCNKEIHSIEKDYYKKENVMNYTRDLIDFNTTDDGFFFIEDLSSNI